MIRMFILSEVDIIHEALVINGAVFNDRPAFLGIMSGSGSKKGMVALESGPFHRYQRLFTREIMRALGIGCVKGEKHFTKSLTELCQHLTESTGRPLDARTTLSSFVFYSFSVFFFGNASDNNQALIKLRDSPTELLHQNPAFILASNILPKHFVEQLMPNKKKLTDSFLEIFQGRRQQQQLKDDTWSTDTSLDSFLDGILAIQKQYMNKNNSSSSSVHDAGNQGDGNHSNVMDKAAAALAPDEHYMQMFFDFFTVGAETSLVELLWVLQMVMLYPEWQRRIQEELDQVVGTEDAPSLLHKRRLHATMATISEVYRFRPVAALGAPHRVTQDMFLRGYFIPEGSYILTNIYAAHHDSKLWKEPDTFDPGRFLDAGGKFKIPNRMVTFSAGQRSCPGEMWTRSLIFLYITTILQKFTLRFPDNEDRPDVMGEPGINYSPCEFKICAVPR
ncbi:cytochrome P450 2D10-like isoform X2 [Patiria miniata]|nr:cytochrome P450 2D10-like isoform X2 [Patiria miniata]